MTVERMRMAKVDSERGYTLERFVSHTAYARNGNAGSPTLTYCWTLRLHGVVVLSSCRRAELVSAARAGLRSDGSDDSNGASSERKG